MKKQKLEDMDKVKAPFQVPEGFFAELETRIREKVAPPPSRTWLPRVSLAYAAAVVVLLLSAVLVLRTFTETPQDAQSLLAEVTDDEILAYLDTHELSEYDIVSLTDTPDDLLPADPNYLEELNLDDSDLDELMNDYGLESDYL